MNWYAITANAAGLGAVALVWWFGMSKSGGSPLPPDFTIQLVIWSILFSAGFFLYGFTSATSAESGPWLRYGCAGLLLIPFILGLLIVFAGHWVAAIIGGTIAGTSLFLISSIPINRRDA
jgi:hypothetical protein